MLAWMGGARKRKQADVVNEAKRQRLTEKDNRWQSQQHDRPSNPKPQQSSRSGGFGTVSGSAWGPRLNIGGDMSEGNPDVPQGISRPSSRPQDASDDAGLKSVRPDWKHGAPAPRVGDLDCIDRIRFRLHAQSGAG